MVLVYCDLKSIKRTESFQLQITGTETLYVGGEKIVTQIQLLIGTVKEATHVIHIE